MGGREAEDEAWRMYSEKVIALSELQMRLFNGSLGATPAEGGQGIAEALPSHGRCQSSSPSHVELVRSAKHIPAFHPCGTRRRLKMAGQLSNTA